MTSTSGPAWGRAVLVTGVPRSGTTWLARLLAQAPRTAMPGREPTNPHAGQFRLAGTLQSWSQLDEPTGRQRRALWRSYRGLEPRTYGRLGVRSWAAPLPWTTVVVKDPSALLALPTVIATTKARPVLVFRHPAAVLASYRRMGWTPDVAEIVAVEPSPAARAPGDEADDVDRMAFFWSACHQIALRPAPGGGTVFCASHEELTRGGEPAVRRLYEACGLTFGDRAALNVRSWTSRRAAARRPRTLSTSSTVVRSTRARRGKTPSRHSSLSDSKPRPDRSGSCRISAASRSDPRAYRIPVYVMPEASYAFDVKL